MTPTFTDLLNVPDIITQDRFLISVQDTRLLCATQCLVENNALFVTLLISEAHDQDRALLAAAQCITLTLFKRNGDTLAEFRIKVRNFSLAGIALNLDDSGDPVEKPKVMAYNLGGHTLQYKASSRATREVARVAYRWDVIDVMM